MDTYAQTFASAREQLDFEDTLQQIRIALAAGDLVRAQQLEGQYQARARSRRYYQQRKADPAFVATRRAYSARRRGAPLALDAREAARQRWERIKADPKALALLKAERARRRAEKEREMSDQWLAKWQEDRRRARLAQKYADLV